MGPKLRPATGKPALALPDGPIKIVADGANEFGIGGADALVESPSSPGGLKESAKFDFFTTCLPGPKPGCTTGGAGLAIPHGISVERKLSAVKFIDFMTTTENTITFTRATGYMPVRKHTMGHPDEKKFLEQNPNAMTTIKQLNENTQQQDAARVFVSGGGQRQRVALGRSIVRNPKAVVHGRATVQPGRHAARVHVRPDRRAAAGAGRDHRPRDP